MYCNCRGIEDNNEYLNIILNRENIDLCNMVETWKLSEFLKIYEYETILPAK